MAIVVEVFPNSAAGQQDAQTVANVRLGENKIVRVVSGPLDVFSYEIGAANGELKLVMRDVIVVTSEANV